VRFGNSKASSRGLFKLPMRALLQFLATATVSAFIASKVLGYQPDYVLFVMAFALVAAGISGATSEFQELLKDRRYAHAFVRANSNQKRLRR
jgi:hypothetical protein